MGTRLFKRRREGMVLTQAGELLADHARRVAMDSDGVLRHIRNLQHAAHSTIRIGTNEGVAHNLLPDIKRFPGCRTVSRRGTTPTQPSSADIRKWVTDT